MTHARLANLPLLDETSAAGKAGEQLKAAKESLGFIPNMYGYMATLPAILLQYNNGYTAFRSEAGFTPIEQEVVFLTISRANNCDYCSAAHSMVADKMSGVPQDVIAAIRTGIPLTDPRLSALVEFTEAMVTTRGLPKQELLTIFLEAGFAIQNVFGIILAISVKTLSNYTNHIAGTKIDDAFSDYAVSQNRSGPL
jgi:AhpD family alkylhydroperoxidase